MKLSVDRGFAHWYIRFQTGGRNRSLRSLPALIFRSRPLGKHPRVIERIQAAMISRRDVNSMGEACRNKH
jgi:hypothetical protein